MAKRPTKRYQTQAGNEPVSEFLAELPAVARELGNQVIEMLETGEIQTRPRHVDSLGGGKSELRWSYLNVQYRIIFAESDGQTWLLSGFVKKTPKTPTKQIRLAHQRLREIKREQKT